MDLLKRSLRFYKSELLTYGSKQIRRANDGTKDKRCVSASVKIVQQRMNQRRFPVPTSPVRTTKPFFLALIP